MHGLPKLCPLSPLIPEELEQEVRLDTLAFLFLPLAPTTTWALHKESETAELQQAHGGLWAALSEMGFASQ
jgi:hypothetical protein